MSRSLLGHLVLTAIVVWLGAQRVVALEDAWERHEAALALHARLGSP